MTNVKDIKFWDRISKKYAQDPIADIPAYEYTLERTIAHLNSTDKVLEIGCGTGTTALKLAPHVAHITGTDIAHGMISIAKERQSDQNIKNATFETKSATDIPKDNQFDAIVAMNMLHLVSDLPATLRAIHSALNHDGVFISKTVCYPQKKGRLSFKLLMKVVPLARLIGKAPFVKIPEIETLEKAITAQGFEIIECGNYPEHPPRRFIVARKC